MDLHSYSAFLLLLTISAFNSLDIHTELYFIHFKHFTYFPPMANLEWTINLACMSLDYGRARKCIAVRKQSNIIWQNDPKPQFSLI